MELRAASRPLVVCLHSSASSARQFAPLADRVGSAFDVVAPDLHGHGAGPAWLGAPRDIVDADAARVARLMSVDRRAHLVGHSYGGLLALKLAVAYPERVKSVTIYEPVMFAALREFAPRSREALAVAWFGRTVARDLRAGLAAHAALRFVDYWSGAGTYADMSAPRREAIVHRMAAVGAHFVSLWGDAMRIRDVAASRVPLTVLMGARTRTPARRIVELLRYARPDAGGGTMTAMGHMGPLTHPAIVAQRLEAELVARERSTSVTERRLAA